MKVRELITELREMDPDATVLMARDGFSLVVEMVEPTQTFCAVSPRHWQRCWVEEDECDRETIQGVLLL